MNDIDWWRNILKDYAQAVMDRYDNAGTQNIKVENARYFVQWIMTGTFARDNPGWKL